jgi:hypothetical protein
MKFKRLFSFRKNIQLITRIMFKYNFLLMIIPLIYSLFFFSFSVVIFKFHKYQQHIDVFYPNQLGVGVQKWVLTSTEYALAMKLYSQKYLMKHEITL